MMLKNSRLKWLTLLSPLLILPLLLMLSSGAQTRRTSSRNSPRLAYLEIISTAQCSSKENGGLTPKQSAQLTHQVVAQMKRLQLIYPSDTVSCSCMKCVHTTMDTATIHSWTSSGDVKSMELPSYLLNQTSGMESFLNSSENISSKGKLNIDIEETRANVRKEDRIIDALEPILNQHRLVIDRLLSTGIINQIKTYHQKNVLVTCSFIK